MRPVSVLGNGPSPGRLTSLESTGEPHSEQEDQDPRHFPAGKPCSARFLPVTQKMAAKSHQFPFTSTPTMNKSIINLCTEARTVILGPQR